MDQRMIDGLNYLNAAYKYDSDALVADNTKFTISNPVSYTHLDVYKRQPQVSTPPVCCRYGSNENVLDLGSTLILFWVKSGSDTCLLYTSLTKQSLCLLLFRDLPREAAGCAIIMRYRTASSASSFRSTS